MIFIFSLWRWISSTYNLYPFYISPRKSVKISVLLFSVFWVTHPRESWITDHWKSCIEKLSANFLFYSKTCSFPIASLIFNVFTVPRSISHKKRIKYFRFMSNLTLKDLLHCWKFYKTCFIKYRGFICHEIF